jgi:hypothetical protein
MTRLKFRHLSSGVGGSHPIPEFRPLGRIETGLCHEVQAEPVGLRLVGAAVGQEHPVLRAVAEYGRYRVYLSLRLPVRAFRKYPGQFEG